MPFFDKNYGVRHKSGTVALRRRVLQLWGKGILIIVKGNA